MRPGFRKRQGASNLVGGKATNKITSTGKGSAEAEAVEAASEPPASKTLDASDAADTEILLSCQVCP